MSWDLTFPKTVAHDKLRLELEAALGENIVDQIDGTPTSVTLHFNRDTTAPEDIIINDVVNAHVSSHLSYKIWDYVVDKPYGWKPPLDLDYKKGLTTRLHPKNTFDQGELTTRQYYSEASVNPLDGSIIFDNLILKEENNYVRDAAGFAIYRTQVISWAYENDEFGPDTKMAIKYYAGIDKIQEGQTRRGNLIDALMMVVAEWLIYNKIVARRTELADPNYNLTPIEMDTELQKGRNLLSSYENEFSSFRNHSDKEILTSIQTDATHSFLDDMVPDQSTDFRTYVIQEMTI